MKLKKMTLNLFLIAFLLAMAVLWGKQGGFSAMLHLLMVVIAGTLALAFWEPVAMMLLTLPDSMAGPIRPFAWGLGLLVPFIVLLIVLRGASDRMVKGNVHLQGTVSQVVGGACGVAAGIFTAGLAIIGMGFLGGPTSLAGYQPYIVAQDSGEIVENPEGGDLWLDVDEWAAGFFTRLSRAGLGGGVFQNTPLAAMRPDLAREAAVFHLRYHDPNASLVVPPGGVSVEGVHVVPTRHSSELSGRLSPDIVDALGEAFHRSGNRVVILETRWRQDAAAYDTDDILRVAPTQVRLLTHSDTDGQPAAQLDSPIGFGKLVNPMENTREFHSTRTGSAYASSRLQEARIAWLFILPGTRDLEAVYLRQLRFPIEQPQVAETGEQFNEIVELLGTPVAGEDSDQADDTPRDRDTQATPEFLERTNRLPRAISKNEVTTLRFGGSDNTLVVSGEALSRRSASSGVDSESLRAEGVFAGSGNGIIRAALTADRARSLLGRARALARDVSSPLALIDDFGQTWEPIGYVWQRGDELELNFRPTQKFRSPSELPVSQMNDEDTLYLYFRVPLARTITGYRIGSESGDDLNMPVSDD
ncbi:MAG: hypothetical protein ACODAQ_12065 [Phycisphaeraceae bacterium]